MRIVLEALIVAVLAAAFGVTANSLSGKRLVIDRDYFAALREPPPVVLGDPPTSMDPTDAPAGVGGDTGEGVDLHGYSGPAAETARQLLERGIQIIGHDEVVALYRDELFEEEAYTFIDARSDEKYSAGHIRQAYVFDHYFMERYLDQVLPACQGVAEVVVYCHGGECTDSEIAAQHLLDLGVDRRILKVYVGGIEQWTAAGLPLERGERGSGDLTAEDDHGG